MTAKRVKQIAKQVDQRHRDVAKMGRTKRVVQVSDVQRFPKQTMTVRIYGMKAAGWDGTSYPPNAIVSAYTIYLNFKDYIPRWFTVNSITLISNRSYMGPTEGDASTAMYGTLGSIAGQALGSWWRFSANVLTAAYDVISQGVLEMSGGGERDQRRYTTQAIGSGNSI